MRTVNESMADRADWSFESDDVAQQFDSYVRGQLPFYDLATQAVADIVRMHLPDGGLLVDVGAATGNIGRAVADLLADRHGRMVAIESSQEMAHAYSAPGELLETRAEDYDMPPVDVVVSFLTLAFLPPPIRTDVVRSWLARIRPGGVFVAVERVKVDAPLICRHLIHAAKARCGESESDVLAKEVSIAGVLRPLPASMLPALGGSLFFAYGDFRGYVMEVEG